MKKTILYCLIVFFASMIHAPASAGDFDGSRALLCSCIRVIQCLPDGNCVQVTPEEIYIPQFMSLNFEQKTISAPQWGEDQPPSRIKNLEHIDGKLMLQGAEDGVKDVHDGMGWTIAISEETGKMVITGSGEQMGIVIFGACTPR
jgi:hypothetical protein